MIYKLFTLAIFHAKTVYAILADVLLRTYNGIRFHVRIPKTLVFWRTFLRVTKEEANSIEVTLSVEMAPEDEDPFIDRSYRRSVGRLNIPGFRKGKAPRTIVESYIGRTALLNEALDYLIPETLDTVLRNEDIQAFAEPQIEITEIEPVTFKAVIPLEPTVNLGEYEDIRIEKEAVEITDEQVNDVLERLRHDSAPWEPVDRPVQYGDLLNITVTGTIDGEEVVNDEGIDYIPQEDNVLPFPGFATNLEGMNDQENKSFTITIPDDYPREQFAGKECAFDLTILSVKEKLLPELDDEFSKGIGDGYDTLEELTSHVRGRLSDEAEAEATRDLESKAIEAIVDLADIEASELLYEREVENMQQERERMLRNQSLDMDTYLSYIGKTSEEFQEELRPTARERLTRFLVLRKLAETESLEISEDDIQKEIDSLIESAGENSDQMRRNLSSDAVRSNIASSLLNQKIMGRIVDITQGITAPENTDDSADKTSETDTKPQNETEEAK
ncbi:MAG: trigger factor [Dehalococcoidia bacterium]|nr:trigger factor [Dehalococcoidia bacterium]|tara:strand:- start:21608 stop:23113 length:1506 start_codon:yes stop_codon:yes gene_type:complete